MDARRAVIRVLRVLVLLLVVLGGLWWVMSISYDDEQPRMQANEGVAAATPLMDSVTEFYANHHRLPTPAELDEPGIGVGPHVAEAHVSPEFIITVTYKGRREIDGKTLTLTPYVDAGALKWRCTLPDIAPRGWPDYCRPGPRP